MVKLRVPGDLISSPNYIRNYLPFLRQIPWLCSAAIFQSVKCLDTSTVLRYKEEKHSCPHVARCAHKDSCVLKFRPKLMAKQSLRCFIAFWTASLLVQQQYLWALFYKPFISPIRYFLLVLAYGFSSLSKFVTMFIAKWKSITGALKKKEKKKRKNR